MWVIYKNPCRDPFFTLACEHGTMQHKGVGPLRMQTSCDNQGEHRLRSVEESKLVPINRLNVPIQVHLLPAFLLFSPRPIVCWVEL